MRPTSSKRPRKEAAAASTSAGSPSAAAASAPEVPIVQTAKHMTHIGRLNAAGSSCDNVLCRSMETKSARQSIATRVVCMHS